MMTRIYIRNARRTGEEQTLSALYIDTDMLPDGVTVKDTARIGAIHADGSIAKAGELTEWTYALVDESVGWQSRTFCPNPALVRWAWEQDNIDAEIEAALEQLRAKKELLTAALKKIDRDAQKQWAIQEARRVAFHTYFKDHAVPVKSARKGSTIVLLDSRLWWVAQKDPESIHIGRVTTNGKTDTKEAASETLPPQERVLIANAKTKQVVRDLMSAAASQAERKFDNEVTHGQDHPLP